jgi:hypothetical protein
MNFQNAFQKDLNQTSIIQISIVNPFTSVYPSACHMDIEKERILVNPLSG